MNLDANPGNCRVDLDNVHPGCPVPQGRRCVVAGVAVVIGPWVARNWWVIGDPSPIESVSLANLWEDNAFPDGPRLERQRHYLREAKDARERQALVWRFVLRGLRERHDYPDKIWGNVRHFLRPAERWPALCSPGRAAHEPEATT